MSFALQNNYNNLKDLYTCLNANYRGLFVYKLKALFGYAITAYSKEGFFPFIKIKFTKKGKTQLRVVVGQHLQSDDASYLRLGLICMEKDILLNINDIPSDVDNIRFLAGYLKKIYCSIPIRGQ